MSRQMRSTSGMGMPLASCSVAMTVERFMACLISLLQTGIGAGMSLSEKQDRNITFAAMFIVTGSIIGACLGIGSIWFMVKAHPGELVPVLIGVAAALGFTMGIALICFWLIKRRNSQLAIAALRRILFEPDL